VNNQQIRQTVNAAYGKGVPFSSIIEVAEALAARMPKKASTNRKNEAARLRASLKYGRMQFYKDTGLSARRHTEFAKVLSAFRDGVFDSYPADRLECITMVEAYGFANATPEVRRAAIKWMLANPTLRVSQKRWRRKTEHDFLLDKSDYQSPTKTTKTTKTTIENKSVQWSINATAQGVELSRVQTFGDVVAFGELMRAHLKEIVVFDRLPADKR
jgi:hypothetical protein